MKWFLDVAYIAISSSYKWVLGMTVIVAVVVGGLFVAGVFGGDDNLDDPLPLVSATPVPTVTPVPSPPPTLVAAATLTPTAVPTATPAPTVEPTLVPTPSPTLVILLPVEFKVPISLEGATNVGSLEFVLRYEPAVLKVTSVEIGELAGNALFQSSIDTPGVVWAGMIDAEGISGDGTAAVITFAVVGDIDSSTILELDRVAAYDATTLLDIITMLSPGSITVKNGFLSVPTLTFVN